MDKIFVSYLRVSTDRQGKSGLGKEAQREAVAQYVVGKGEVKFVEDESGTRNDRPELAKALEMCEVFNAVLIVGKLDRLAREVGFLLKLSKDCKENGIVFCDLPNADDGPVGKFIITQMASVAELEVGLIRKRTKDALAQAKKRYQAAAKRNTLREQGKLEGPMETVKQLGGKRVSDDRMAEIAAVGRPESLRVRQAKAAKKYKSLLPIIKRLKDEGTTSFQGIAKELNVLKVPTPRKGKGKQWTATQVMRVIRAS
jgi:DNA invertase Pin-like site-specific DNA recombinase